MTVLNDLDRFHLVMDSIDRLPQTGAAGVELKGRLAAKLVEHKRYIREHGQDMPEIRNWRWKSAPLNTNEARDVIRVEGLSAYVLRRTVSLGLSLWMWIWPCPRTCAAPRGSSWAACRGQYTAAWGLA